MILNFAPAHAIVNGMNGTHGNPVLFHVGVVFKQELEVKELKNNLEDWNVKVNPQSPKPVVVIHAPVRFLHLRHQARPLELMKKVSLTQILECSS